MDIQSDSIELDGIAFISGKNDVSYSSIVSRNIFEYIKTFKTNKNAIILNKKNIHTYSNSDKHLEEEFSKFEKIIKTTCEPNLYCVLSALKDIISSYQSNDIVILDNIDGNLHPHGRVILSEMLCLMKKFKNINSVIISTNLETFVAIDVYSKVHYIQNKCKYYILDNVTIKNSSVEEIYNIFSQLSDLFDIENEIKLRQGAL